MKKTLYTLNYIFGIFIILLGAFMIPTSPLPAIPCILLGCLLCPPIRLFFYRLTNKAISPVNRVTLSVVLVFVFLLLVVQHQESKDQSLASEQKQKQIEQFLTEKPSILTQLNQLYNNKQYQDLITLANNYSFAEDPDITNIKHRSENQIKTDTILKQLNDVPESEPAIIASLYEQLTTLNPGNTEYISKLDQYTKRAKTKEDKRLAQKQRNELIDKSFSPWSGAHYGLQLLIKKNMNDPESYDHVRTSYSDKGDHLLVQTTFRGKNAFGAKIINTVIAKCDLEGNVLEVISQ